MCECCASTSNPTIGSPIGLEPLEFSGTNIVRDGAVGLSLIFKTEIKALALARLNSLSITVISKL